MKWVKSGPQDFFVSATCEGEKCLCGKDAVRKIGEEIAGDDPNPARHNFTAYVCAECYANVLGIVAARSVGLKPADVEAAQNGVTAAEFMTDTLQMNIADLPADRLDFPIIEGEAPQHAYVKFMSHAGDYDEVLADRFEQVLEDLNVTYIRTTPRVLTGDLSKLPGVVENWDAG